jgi:hypothetical protein
VGTTDATVWLETDEACEVEILGCRERTWNVAGHHYALVLIEGLEPGSTTRYEVRLDGDVVWPPPDWERPPSRIRTEGGDRDETRLAFGSCRYGRFAAKLHDRHFTPDSLRCYARELMDRDEAHWPDGVLMLGDQVYADETSDATQRKIRAKRPVTDDGPGTQVADFEEYTWLYLESWTDPEVRWLMSTIPSTMIFDDHDIHDDWNTSDSWRQEMQRTTWWQDRIAGGLASYWVYQHLGNLSPDELRTNDLYQRVRTAGTDVAPLLREFALHADAEVDGAKGTRWSYRRDFGSVRLLMIDSRCGRILADGNRSMVSDDEFAWITDQAKGTYDHLLIGTSLPWLLARALHDLESWDEVLCTGSHGPRRARFGEWLRRAADLEHWAAFRESFDALADLISAVGNAPEAPATVCVLSGDVHHAYFAEARFPTPVRSRVYQLTCSPLHNFVPPMMKAAFRIFWSRVMEHSLRRLLGWIAPLPRLTLEWRKLDGPFFGNELAEFVARGRDAEAVLRRSTETNGGGLEQVAHRTLTG